MAEPFIGQIVLFAGTYAPVGWALCFGQVMNVVEYQTLYAVIGTAYGGNGNTTFMLPDLRGRMPIGTGVVTPGPTIVPQSHLGYDPLTQEYNIPSGLSGGSSQVVLTQDNLPPHTHPLAVSSAVDSATSADPTNAFLANTTISGDPSGNLISTSVPLYSTKSNATAATQAVGSVGASAPVVVEPPYIAINYIIALTGTFPTRS